jgi:hypothetical protein
MLEDAALAGIGPVAAQGQALFPVRVVVDKALAGRAKDSSFSGGCAIVGGDWEEPFGKSWLKRRCYGATGLECRNRQLGHLTRDQSNSITNIFRTDDVSVGCFQTNTGEDRDPNMKLGKAGREVQP